MLEIFSHKKYWKLYSIHDAKIVIITFCPTKKTGSEISNLIGGRRGRDRMVVGITTTYAISANHH